MRVGHCQAPKLDESQPEKSADMAQLVERTLGKGEVESSILSRGTSFHLNCRASVPRAWIDFGWTCLHFGNLIRATAGLLNDPPFSIAERRR